MVFNIFFCEKWNFNAFPHVFHKVFPMEKRFFTQNFEFFRKGC